MKKYLLADIGSTTTKALYCVVYEDHVDVVGMADAPTTVEAPNEDVKIGLAHALSRLQEQLDLHGGGERPGLIPHLDVNNNDGLLLTSSAGGGLQMLVIGLVRSMTGESAERAALGGGGVILDVLASNDNLEPFQRVDRIRSHRPDMILLAGGTEGGALLDVAKMAENLYQANPHSRFDSEQKLPLIYAGNTQLQPFMQETANDFELTLVDNLRPELDRENLAPARLAIQEQFLNHVMEHAPGYAPLKGKVSAPILPTPMAVTRSLHLLARRQETNLLAVDIGGATTDVFSVIDGAMNRSVSAHLGMSYSAMNVLREAGVYAIMRWLPGNINERQLRNWVHNKMLFPATLPHDEISLLVEQAVAREALRLALDQHQQLVVELKGNVPVGDWKRSSQDFFNNRSTFDIENIGLIIGSGGVISHAPSLQQAAALLVDAFLPLGWTDLMLDRNFTLPHIGALSQIDADSAFRLLTEYSLVSLGACLVPKGASFFADAGTIKVTVEPQTGASREHRVRGRNLHLIPLEEDQACRIHISGVLNLDFGNGFWRGFERNVEPSKVGLLLDTRGRALPWAKQLSRCQNLSTRWRESLGQPNH